MRFILCIIAMLLATQIFARANYTGYSGAPGRQTCAISCHGNSSGTMQVVGFPAEYTPGQQYRISIRKTSGSSIRNFNASCRVGTGSTNAGVITASTNTAVYSVTGETNGIHLSTSGRDSGVFNWTAPAAGTGTVRLYMGGMQGTSANGPNTTYIGTSNEIIANLPGAASNPNPLNGAVNIIPGVNRLTWSPGANANSYDVYFGTTNPPVLAGFRSDTTYTTDTLMPGITYHWRVDSRNANGFTQGTAWSFTTLVPSPALNPQPANSDTITTNPVTLQWDIAATVTPTNIVLRLGTQNPPPVIDTLASDTRTHLDSLLQSNVTYYWQVDQIFPWGVTTGTTWSFVYNEPSTIHQTPTALPNAIRLEPAYPNPFNPITTIRYAIPQSASVTLKVYNLAGNEVASLVEMYQPAGNYAVNWDASNVVSGVYFYRLTVNHQTLSGRMQFVK
ncbi:MAG: T9SS type A sorting domain-containing protein [bacterium]|nr:T9SS type A sorting domain-containing protein [bacterium]